ncbi:MAG: hypothetical protein WBL27_09880 [Salinimicrobium sp.]
MKLESLKQDKYYHIYNRGINGSNIFTSDRNREFFLQLYKKHVSGKITTFAYCLLNNHYHFAIRVDTDPKEVTQSFSNFFNAYAKAFNKAENRTGSLFEKHFKRVVLDSEKYLQQIILYIHKNPQEHFEILYEKYRFSSFQEIKNKASNIVNHQEVLTLFDGRENFLAVHRNGINEIDESLKIQ